MAFSILARLPWTALGACPSILATAVALPPVAFQIRMNSSSETAAAVIIYPVVFALGQAREARAIPPE